MTFLALRGLRHLPFFEALGTLDTASREWASTSAGLVTLRLMDLLRAQESGGATVVAAEVAAVRDAIAAMPAGELTRSILGSVVDAATQKHGGSTERALPSLLAYGKALQLAARWALAADVYETILEHPASGEQGDIALQAALKCAYCLRVSARYEEAERAYDRVRALAVERNDRAAVFFSEIGRANIARQRGNYPRAEAMLDRIIDAAIGAGCEVAAARALHERGHVAYQRGQREEALRYLHRALVEQTDLSQRDRLLGDIALVLGELGHLEGARDVHLLIEVTAQEQDVRWMAALNLMELAAGDGDEITFERHRRRLASEPLSPPLAVLYQLHTATGFQCFGRLEAARSALEDALALASRHQLHDLAFRAEAALQRLGSDAPSVRPAASSVVDDVLHTVRTLRDMAGATG